MCFYKFDAFWLEIGHTAQFCLRCLSVQPDRLDMPMVAAAVLITEEGDMCPSRRCHISRSNSLAIAFDARAVSRGTSYCSLYVLSSLLKGIWVLFFTVSWHSSLKATRVPWTSKSLLGENKLTERLGQYSTVFSSLTWFPSIQITDE